MIILLSNYRVGSSSFLKEYAEKSGAVYSIKGKPYTTEYHHGFDGGYKPPDCKINLYKVMPDQVKNNFEEFKKDFLDESKEIIYLARRNFTKQVLSLAVCAKTQNWHPWQENFNQRFSDTHKSSFVLDLPTYKKHEEELLYNLKQQSLIYKSYPGEVFYLEDRYSKQKEYPNKVKIVNQEDFYSDVNVEEYFQ